MTPGYKEDVEFKTLMPHEITYHNVMVFIEGRI